VLNGKFLVDIFDIDQCTELWKVFFEKGAGVCEGKRFRTLNVPKTVFDPSWGHLKSNRPIDFTFQESLELGTRFAVLRDAPDEDAAAQEMRMNSNKRSLNYLPDDKEVFGRINTSKLLRSITVAKRMLIGRDHRMAQNILHCAVTTSKQHKLGATIRHLRTALTYCPTNKYVKDALIETYTALMIDYEGRKFVVEAVACCEEILILDSDRTCAQSKLQELTNCGQQMKSRNESISRRPNSSPMKCVSVGDLQRVGLVIDRRPSSIAA
jgi:hypothetical protein